MPGFKEFEEQQKTILRNHIIQHMNDSKISSLHELYQRQNLIVASKLTEEEIESWEEISRTTLYKLQDYDANPELNTLIKICFLLGIECGDLFSSTNKGGKS